MSFFQFHFWYEWKYLLFPFQKNVTYIRKLISVNSSELHKQTMNHDMIPANRLNPKNKHSLKALCCEWRCHLDEQIKLVKFSYLHVDEEEGWKVIWVSKGMVQTLKWRLTWPNFCVSEQAKVVILFLAKISPLVPWIAGGGTRNLAGNFKSPSYCIMPTNFVCINSHAPSLITYLRWLDPSLI